MVQSRLTFVVVITHGDGCAQPPVLSRSTSFYELLVSHLFTINSYSYTFKEIAHSFFSHLTVINILNNANMTLFGKVLSVSTPCRSMLETAAERAILSEENPSARWQAETLSPITMGNPESFHSRYYLLHAETIPPTGSPASLRLEDRPRVGKTSGAQTNAPSPTQRSAELKGGGATASSPVGMVNASADIAMVVR